MDEEVDGTLYFASLLPSRTDSYFSADNNSGFFAVVGAEDFLQVAVARPEEEVEVVRSVVVAGAEGRFLEEEVRGGECSKWTYLF